MPESLAWRLVRGKFVGSAVLMKSQNPHPFDFVQSKIPTSRAKNAREMGHPCVFEKFRQVR
jgi:hypothetical protein